MLTADYARNELLVQDIINNYHIDEVMVVDLNNYGEVEKVSSELYKTRILDSEGNTKVKFGRSQKYGNNNSSCNRATSLKTFIRKSATKILIRASQLDKNTVDPEEQKVVEYWATNYNDDRKKQVDVYIRAIEKTLTRERRKETELEAKVKPLLAELEGIRAGITHWEDEKQKILNPENNVLDFSKLQA